MTPIMESCVMQRRAQDSCIDLQPQQCRQGVWRGKASLCCDPQCDPACLTRRADQPDWPLRLRENHTVSLDERQSVSVERQAVLSRKGSGRNELSTVTRNATQDRQHLPAALFGDGDVGAG